GWGGVVGGRLLSAAAARLKEQAVDVGRPLEVFLNAPGGGHDFTVTFPGGGKKEGLKSIDLRDGSVARFLDTDEAGAYRINIGSEPRDHVFAVNAPALNNDQQSESDLARTSLEEMKTAYPEWDLQAVRKLDEADHKPVDAEGPVEMVYNPLGPAIARILLLCVLGLVFLE